MESVFLTERCWNVNQINKDKYVIEIMDKWVGDELGTISLAVGTVITVLFRLTNLTSVVLKYTSQTALATIWTTHIRQ